MRRGVDAPHLDADPHTRPSIATSMCKASRAVRRTAKAQRNDVVVIKWLCMVHRPLARRARRAIGERGKRRFACLLVLVTVRMHRRLCLATRLGIHAELALGSLEMKKKQRSKQMHDYKECISVTLRMCRL